MFTQNGHNVIRHLQESAANMEALVRSASAHAQLTFPQQHKHGRMAAQYAQLSVPSGHDDLIRLAFKDGTVR